MLDADPGAERCLKEIFTGGGDAVPAYGVVISRKNVGRVKPFVANQTPGLGLDDLTVKFSLPDNFQWAAKIVRVGTRELQDRAAGRGDDLIDQVMALADPDQSAGHQARHRLIINDGRLTVWLVP